MLIYNTKIKKSPNNHLAPGIECCSGWDDYENMGISCICCYDYEQGRYRVFLDDNMAVFQTLVCSHDVIAGFNNIGFDNRVIQASGLFDIDFEAKSYDLLREIWIAAGIEPEFDYPFPSYEGYDIDAVMQANFSSCGKIGHDAIAPIYYQQGDYGSLIDCCLADVGMIKRLLDRVVNFGKIISPKDGSILMLRKPAYQKIVELPVDKNED